MALRQKAARSVLWSGLESASTSLIAFLSLIVFATLLQPRDFGVFSISLAVVETAGIFSVGGQESEPIALECALLPLRRSSLPGPPVSVNSFWPLLTM